MNNNNNWLGFSLSPQQVVQEHQTNFNSSDEISSAQISGESCFDSANIPSLNRPFGILEAFNTNNNHSQVEWNMNDVNINTYSCSSSQQQQQQQQHQNMEDGRPKLENFLGVDHHDNYNNNIRLYQQTSEAASANNNNNNNNIGLSMITNWLRNSNKEEEAAPQTLSLCMSTGSSSSDTKIAAATATATAAALALVEGQTQTPTPTAAAAAIESVPRKSIDTFGQRTSIYRGVTRHRWTGRYEAHLWDNSCRREGQTRKGRQVYLGGYDKEDKAARAYDLAALKYWGTTTTTNFPMSNYEKEIEEMKHMTRQEYVASLRRKSSGFSRGASMYRGVTRHHQHGRWQARIGRVAGNKDLYLGTFSTEEEAAEAYDIAAIKFRGLNAVTNFEINRYDVKSILESSTLPIGGAAKRLKDAEKAEMALLRANESSNTLNLHLTDHTHHNHQMAAAAAYSAWPTIAFQPSSHQQQLTTTMYPPHFQRLWCKQEHDATDGFNDINHQLQLGNNTHNFMHNIMDSSNTSAASMMMGMGTVIVPDVNNSSHGFLGQDEGKNLEYEAAMFGSADHHAYQQARTTANYYNYQQQSTKSTNIGLYDQGSTASTNWIPTAVPTNMAAAACHGASTFTVWNDT